MSGATDSPRGGAMDPDPGGAMAGDHGGAMAGDHGGAMAGDHGGAKDRDPGGAARTPDDGPARAGRRRWTAVLRPVLALVLVGGAGYGMWSALRGSGSTLQELFSREGAAPWLIGSLVINTAGLALSMGSWRTTLTSLGSPLPWGPTFRIFGATVLGKYLPGPFWSALAGVHLGRRSGVAAKRMIAAYVLNSVVVLLTAAVVGALAGPRVMGTGALWLLPVAGVLAVLLLRPGIIVRAAALAARILRRPTPELSVAEGPLRRAVVLEVLSWLVGGAHLWMIAVVLGAPVAGSLALCVGGFALAAAAGAAALVVPGGAGVREIVLMVVLTVDLPWSQAGAAALASRLCCTVTEIVGAGSVLLLARWTPGGRAAAPTARVGEVPSGV